MLAHRTQTVRCRDYVLPRSRASSRRSRFDGLPSQGANQVPDPGTVDDSLTRGKTKVYVYVHRHGYTCPSSGLKAILRGGL